MRRLAVAVGLLNAFRSDHGRPWPGHVFDDAGYRAPGTDAEWTELLLGVDGLSKVVALIVDEAEDEAVATINARLEEFRVVPRIETVGGARHLHFHALDAGYADGWMAGIFAALALSCATGELDRIGRCHAEGCDNLFLDRGRSKRRRFCSLRCQDRVKSASYRVRLQHR